MGLLEEFGNRNAVNTKAQTLASTREDKLLTLFGSRDEPNVVTAPSLQQSLSDAINEQIYTSPSGQKYQEKYSKDARGNTVITKVPYDAVNKYGQPDTENLYIDNTKQGNYKLGLARSDKGFMGRYTPDASGYGWTPGPMGVTPQNGALLDVTLPRDLATKLEYDVHSNVGQIRNRAIGQGPVSAQDIAMFGSGKTEYTTPNAPMWNQNYRDPGTPLLSGTPMPGTSHVGNLRKSSTPHTDALLSESSMDGSNLLKAVGSGALNTSSKLAQMIAKGTELGGEGLTALGATTPGTWLSEEAKQVQAEQAGARKTGLFDKVTGYDASVVKKMGSQFADQVQKKDYFGAVKNVLSNPEGMATAFLNSAPEMAAMWTPVGLGVMATANANAAVQDTRTNAQAQGLPPPTAMDEAKAIGVSVVSTYLDRLGDKVMMGSVKIPDNIRESLGKTISAMTPEVKSAALRAFGGTLGKLGMTAGEFGIKTGVEGGTEYLQTLGEGKASDMTKMNLDITPAEQRQALEAFGVGMGAGGVGAGVTMAPGILEDVKRGTNQGLDVLAEVSTGKTKEDVLAKNIKEQAAKSYTPEAQETLDTLATQRSEVQAKIDALDIESPTYTQERKDLGVQMADIKQQVSDVKTKAQEEAIVTPMQEEEETPAATEAKADKPVAEDAAIDLEEQLSNISQHLKDQGMDQTEIDTKIQSVRERYTKAGIANLTSLHDRASKVSVDVIDDVSPREVSKKKEQLFDPYEMSDTKVGEVIKEGFETSDKNTFLKRVAKKLGYNSKQHAEVQGVAEQVESNMGKVQESMSQVLPKGASVTVANVMRAVALGVSNIKSGMISETDIANKQGISRKSNAARKPQLDIQIGKAYINSFGFKLGGKSEDTAKAYQEMGNKIIQVMKDLGMVEESVEDLSAHNMVGKDGKPLTETSAKEMGLQAFKDNKGKLLIKMPTLVLKGDTDKLSGALNTFSKLFTPPNIELPQEGGQEFVVMSKGAEAVKISKPHENIIKEYSELKYKIKSEFMQMLKDLKEMRDTKYDGDFDKMLYAKPEIKELLNLEDSKTEFLRMGESGRKINKTGNLARLLDNLDALEGEFNFHYESAINERIHVLQTILDYQGDKFMARQMITGGEYTTRSEKELQLLVEDVADALGVEPEDVLKPSGILKKAVDSMVKRNGTLSLTDTLTVIKGMKSTTPFKTMSAVKAMYDISMRDGNKVTTDYMVESDATASGVMNTLMNLAGYPKVQTLLRKMGVGKGADLSQKLDPYLIVNEYIEDVYSKENSLTYMEKIKPTMDALVAVFVKDTQNTTMVKKFTRNLAKKPIMTWFYGQTGENTKIGMGNSIAVDLIEAAIKGNYKALSYINEITGKKYAPDSTDIQGGKANFIGDITKADADVKALTDHFADTVGSMYVSSMEELFSDVEKYRKTMGDIYTLLDNSKSWEGTIKSAMGTMTGAKEKMSIQKLKSMAMKDIDKEILLVNKMMNNKTSFNVNLQHATDAALLLMTLKDVMKDSGIMTVHDAFYSDTKTAMKVMDAYNKYAVKAAMEYDYTETAIKEAEEIVSGMKDGIDKTKAMNKLNDIKEAYAPIKEAKGEYLTGVKTDVLGNNLWTGDEVTEEVQEATKSEEVVEHNERVYATFSEALKVLKNTKMPIKMRVASLLESINIPESHRDLADKVIAALDDTNIGFKSDEKYAALPWTVFVDTGAQYMEDVRYDHREPHTVESIIETLAHEVDHAYQMAYIEEFANTTEVKYLHKALQVLKTKSDSMEHMLALSDEARERVNYIATRPTDNEALAEMIAIMNNEKTVMDEISSMIGNTSLIQKIKDIVNKIKAYVKTLTTEKKKQIIDKAFKEDSYTALELYSAIAQMDANARVNTSKATSKDAKVKPLGIAETREDVHKEIYMNPYKYANEILAKQNQYVSGWMMIFGDTMVEQFGPGLHKAHTKAMRTSDVYRSTVSLLRSGFVTSDFAQRMHTTLGINNDSKVKLLDKVQTLGTAMMQESVKTLENMAQLDRAIEKAYNKEDRVRVYQLFAKTGIANLQYDKDVYENIMNGTMTVKDAMAKVSASLDPSVVDHLDEVAHYYITGKTVTGNTNTLRSGDYRNETKVYTTLKAISMITNGEKLLTSMDKSLKNELMGLALSVHALHMEINEQGMGITGRFHTGTAQFDINHDGHYSMDVHEKMYEYRAVSKRDMKGSTYTSENEWKVVREPTDTTMGLVARDSYNPGGVPGIGLELNKFSNGVYLNAQQSEEILGKLEAMTSESDKISWLHKNGMSRDGRRIKVLVDEQTKADMLSMKQNVAHSLYRTLVHNQELVQSQAIRDIMLNEGTLQINNEEDMRAFAKKLTKNRQEGLRGDREEVHPFVKINYDYGNYDDLPKDVKLYFKSPRNLTTYNSFHKGITLVKRGEADVLLGHENFSLFGKSDNRNLTKVEAIFKKMVVLAKQKMIVTNPMKLLADLASNVGILQMKDMTPFDIWDGFKDGWAAYHEFSTMRSDMVLLTVDARRAHADMQMNPKDAGVITEHKKALAKLDAKEKEMKTHRFYDSFQAGFVQSYSTDMVIKEFDTISGVQKDINDVIDRMTHDKKGNPNAIYNAIKKWQEFGGDKLSLDSWMAAAGKSAKLKGTTVGDEMVAIAERLKSKKDAESVADYISNIIGAPSSEIVSYGGAAMVVTDVLSKYTLANFLMGRRNPATGKTYTKEEAYYEANQTFIDYRYNIPQEIKALSDYGILMFPAFWLKVQKVIASLVKYHPINSLGGYAIESALGINSVNVLNEAFPMKLMDDSVIHDPTSTIGIESVFAFL